MVFFFSTILLMYPNFCENIADGLQLWHYEWAVIKIFIDEISVESLDDDPVFKDLRSPSFCNLLRFGSL